MLPKILSLYKAQTVTARQILILGTDPSFSWSSDDNELSTEFYIPIHAGYDKNCLAAATFQWIT